MNSAERRYAQSLRTLAALMRALLGKKRQGDGWVGLLMDRLPKPQQSLVLTDEVTRNTAATYNPGSLTRVP